MRKYNVLIFNVIITERGHDQGDMDGGRSKGSYPKIC